ncbi:hypothetical protein C2G38_2117434 [Gigaspora rosea]|uniref:Uncharacterized protein n=1 Tax=Gigaspora rosea TaxID=44941 RepID=A0A397U821_9GLOM|nr:hypothetical protein C2G38_2117434 [Gigaspora rosea]
MTLYNPICLSLLKLLYVICLMHLIGIVRMSNNMGYLEKNNLFWLFVEIDSLFLVIWQNTQFIS